MSSITFISTLEGYSWGGSEELWSQTALALTGRGVHVNACVKHWNPISTRITELKSANCQLKFRRTSCRWQSVSNKLSLRSVNFWLKHSNSGLVVISLACHSNGTSFARLCSKSGIPYVLIVQAAGEHAWPIDEELAHLAKTYEDAQVCYFVSEGNQHLIERQIGVQLNNAKVVRNPFNVSHDIQTLWPTSKDGLKLACVGRLHPASKGQDILFDVLKQEKWRQRDLFVTLIGNGPNERSLMALKDMYRLDKVMFAGSISNVASIWDSHHALILPSRYEGLPLVVVEAMMCGRPCIVTDVAGNTELVDDNSNGFVAAAPTARLLDEALERAWANRAEWQAMGQEAAYKVRQIIPPDPAGVFANELMLLQESLT